MQQLTLPPLPDGSNQVTVEHVYVAAGEQVQRGQALVLVRTERFAYDLPAAAAACCSSCTPRRVIGWTADTCWPCWPKTST